MTCCCWYSVSLLSTLLRVGCLIGRLSMLGLWLLNILESIESRAWALRSRLLPAPRPPPRAASPDGASPTARKGRERAGRGVLFPRFRSSGLLLSWQSSLETLRNLRAPSRNCLPCLAVTGWSSSTDFVDGFVARVVISHTDTRTRTAIAVK